MNYLVFYTRRAKMHLKKFTLNVLLLFGVSCFYIGREPAEHIRPGSPIRLCGTGECYF